MTYELLRRFPQETTSPPPWRLIPRPRFQTPHSYPYNISLSTFDQHPPQHMAISQQKPSFETSSHFSTSSGYDESSNDSGFAEITNLLMADPDPTTGTTDHKFQLDPTVEVPLDEDIGETNATAPRPSATKESSYPKNNMGPWFNLDDVPPH